MQLFRFLGSGSFLLTALFFLLPFVTVSCPAGRQTVSGVSLAIGSTVETPQLFGPPVRKKVDGDPVALAALACAVLGIVAASIPRGSARLAAVTCAIAGAVLLLVLQSKITKSVQSQGMGMQVAFDPGYWLALAGFVLAFAATIAWRFLPTIVARNRSPATPAPRIM